jgi:uncharacterized membrane protein
MAYSVLPNIQTDGGKHAHQQAIVKRANREHGDDSVLDLLVRGLALRDHRQPVLVNGLYLRASLLFPWCPIYGIGGLIIVAALAPMRGRLSKRVSKPVELVLMSVAIFVLTAAVELAGSYVCEMLMGYVPWDYSDAWMNFDGRIAPAFTLRFVVLGLVALYLVYPWVRRWVTEHSRTAILTAIVLAVLLVLDYVLDGMGVWMPVKNALVPLGIRHW